MLRHQNLHVVKTEPLVAPRVIKGELPVRMRSTRWWCAPARPFATSLPAGTAVSSP